ncbi:MAG TPA: DNA repair protein RecO [Phycisphaerales bacterium]|nr:DNA repair protein RecO [Phycisphaerales bacterium]
MATIRDEALCIRHWDWSETSQTVSLFSRGHGLIRGLAKGAKREKGQFSGGIELLTRGEVVAIVKGGQAMATLTAWDLLELFPAARRTLGAFHVGIYLADLLHHTVTHEDPHPALYDRMVEALRDLARSEQWALLCGQWAVLTETGHRPEVGADVRTGETLSGAERVAFSPRLGGMVRVEHGAMPADAWGVRPETATLLAELDRRTASLERADLGAVARGARLLAAYSRFLLDRELPSVSPLFGEGGLPL